MQSVHVVGQLYSQQRHLEAHPGDNESYSCLWQGCKVFGKRSCSGSWLEKHVPVHGGRFAHACIVDGCRARFSTQRALQKHVNQHFGGAGCKDEGGRRPQGGAKPKDKAQALANTLSESSKNLKRAGVKLKFRRHNVFSARIFDFFDVGIMAGIRHGVSELEARAPEDLLELRSEVTGMKVDSNTGERMARVTWTPEDM